MKAYLIIQADDYYTTNTVHALKKVTFKNRFKYNL